jgi:hypothetical protein
MAMVEFKLNLLLDVLFSSGKRNQVHDHFVLQRYIFTYTLQIVLFYSTPKRLAERSCPDLYPWLCYQLLIVVAAAPETIYWVI